MINVTVNGNIETIEPCTIGEYLTSKDLNPLALVVEHNREIVKSQRWAEICLEEGDTLELLGFVGGG